jgi:hypothetical protein
MTLASLLARVLSDPSCSLSLSYIDTPMVPIHILLRQDFCGYSRVFAEWSRDSRGRSDGYPIKSLIHPFSDTLWSILFEIPEYIRKVILRFYVVVQDLQAWSCSCGYDQMDMVAHQAPSMDMESFALLAVLEWCDDDICIDRTREDIDPVYGSKCEKVKLMIWRDPIGERHKEDTIRMIPIVSEISCYATSGLQIPKNGKSRITTVILKYIKENTK